MTPKEKAKELVDKFYPFTYSAINAPKINQKQSDAVKCALVEVDEIIDELTNLFDTSYSENLLVRHTMNRVDFWKKVKQEIKKL